MIDAHVCIAQESVDKAFHKLAVAQVVLGKEVVGRHGKLRMLAGLEERLEQLQTLGLLIVLAYIARDAAIIHGTPRSRVSPVHLVGRLTQHALSFHSTHSSRKVSSRHLEMALMALLSICDEMV